MKQNTERARRGRVRRRRAAESRSSVLLRCTDTVECDFHRDGGPKSERCPGLCDWPACASNGHYEVGSDRTLCCLHGAVTLLARVIREALARDGEQNSKEGR